MAAPDGDSNRTMENTRNKLDKVKTNQQKNAGEDKTATGYGRTQAINRTMKNTRKQQCKRENKPATGQGRTRAKHMTMENTRLKQQKGKTKRQGRT